MHPLTWVLSLLPVEQHKRNKSIRNRKGILRGQEILRNFWKIVGSWGQRTLMIFLPIKRRGGRWRNRKQFLVKPPTVCEFRVHGEGVEWSETGMENGRIWGALAPLLSKELLFDTCSRAKSIRRSLQLKETLSGRGAGIAGVFLVVGKNWRERNSSSKIIPGCQNR